MEAMMTTFGKAFNEIETYTQKRPSADYLKKLLDNTQFIAIAALDGDKVIGGLIAYELQKFEQERSEIYIYDLAVDDSYRRQGIATRLIEELKSIGAKRGAYVILVQADPEDEPAISLYTKLGIREDVLHFDIPI